MLDDELRTEELAQLVRRVSGGCAERVGPAGLSPRVLSGLVEEIAARPQLWEPCVRHEDSYRWYGSLYRDDVVDLWLLTWQQDNSTDLHDHGGSCGAFRVLSGALTEFRPVGGPRGTTLGQYRRTAGRTVSFGPQLVHDVHNVDVVPAVSLHVYSPPLTSMTYYEVIADRLATRHTEPVDVQPADETLPGRALTVDA